MRPWTHPLLVRQRGQALTEFLVACLALVPLFLLMPMIGKYQDVSHSALMASRYVAFEATNRHPGVNSWKAEDQLALEVRRRFFSSSYAPIKTGDVAGNFAGHRNLAWTDGFGNPLITQIDRDVTVSFGPGRGASHANAISSASDGNPFSGLGLWGFDRFGLSRQGIYTANVSVALANLPAGLRFIQPFDDINLVITRSSSLIVDPWSARDPGAVQSRLDATSLHPGRAMRIMEPVVDVAVQVLEGTPLGLGNIRGPGLGRLDYWQDVVPADRLR